MRINIFTLILLLSSIVFPALAQIQQGFVKTLGRPDKKGVALSGVSVRLKGGHNAVLSKDDGTFSMMMTGKKVGDAYSLQQVQKAGYELNEVGVIGRQYAFSDKVPLTIVMVSTSQLQADKQRIENNAYKVAEKNYQAKLAQLEKDKEAGTISIETFSQEFQDLKDRFEKYQSLIDGLAEHYAHTDYDVLDEKEREINICIENGDLERADSLIHTIFDPIDVLKRNKEALARIDQNIQQSKDIMAQANADMAAVLKQQEKDAEYLYQLYTISAGKFDFEKATYYIELRAELDTTNADWQFDAAYYCQKQNQFHKATTYYERAIELYKQMNRSSPLTYELDVAQTLNNLAILYSDTQRFEESETMYKEALEISHRLAVSNPQTYEPYMALTSMNLAALYLKTQHLEESEAMFKEALQTYRRLAASNPQAYEPDVASTLNNLASMYKDTQRLAESEAMYKEALEICRRLAVSNPLAYEPDVARTLNNMAILYKDTHRLAESEAMYKEALEIRHRLAASNAQAYEPDVARTLNNMAILYSDTQRLEESEAMYKEALETYRRLAAPNPQAYGSDVAMTLNNMALLYLKTQRLDESEAMYKEALETYRRLAAPNPQAYEPDVARTLNNLANLYYRTQCLEESEAMYKEAMEIYRCLAAPNPQAYESDVAQTQYNLGLLKVSMEQYREAIAPFEEALDIFRRLSKTNPAQQQWYEGSLCYLSLLYPTEKNYLAAYKANQEWLPIFKKQYEADMESRRNIYAVSLGNQSYCAIFAKQYAEADLYAREGLAVDSTKHFIYTNLAVALLFQGKYAEAEAIYRQYKDELKDSFLDDFKQFAEAGVIPEERKEDVERFKQMLNEK